MANITNLVAELDEKRQRLDRTSLDLSFNEIADMISAEELNIQPDYQRLFQWSEAAQSRFIETLLLDMPIPPIFVVEEEENRYLLIDGLQRISSYLHFRGMLNLPSRGIPKGSKLKLKDCDIVPSINGLTYDDLPTSLQIRLKRNFVRVEVVRHGSDPHYKYFMFKRLNTGGVPLSDMQLRNCTIRLLSSTFNDFIIELSKDLHYISAISNLSEEQERAWYDQELVLRFFALKNWRKYFSHEVGDFLTEYMEGVSETDPARSIPFEYATERESFLKTFAVLDAALGDRVFSRPNKAGNELVDAFGIYHFESISIGVQKVMHQLDWRDEAQMKTFGGILRTIKLDPTFTAMTKGGGKNSTGLLARRISFVEDTLVAALK